MNKENQHITLIALDSPRIIERPFMKMPNFEEHIEELPNISLDWIPLEYDRLTYMLRKAGMIQDHRISCNKILKNSFKEDDLITWITNKKKMKRSEALSACHLIIERIFPTGNPNEVIFYSDIYYQLPEDDQCQPLNIPIFPSSSGPYLTNVGEYNDRLCEMLEPIYDEILSENRRLVHYELLEDNDTFQKYLVFARGAAALDIAAATVQERLAFFTNIYNIMTLHIIYKYGMASNVWERRKYQNSIYYQIGKYNYSLQSIYNGILRGNKKGLGMLWEPFGPIDARREFAINGGEPLVHFAINNCTKSCPPIRAYSTQGVYAEMKLNAKKTLMCDEFLRIDRKKSIIAVTKIFRWYSRDFAVNQEDVIQWIVDLFPDKVECKRPLIDMFYEGKYTISHLPANIESNMICGPKIEYLESP
ncbi:hypothetical protein Ddc_02077 [Ditylenchus destructor]|nr:hypothetical protein Ddc_02077 [Ditylenchus destructor]